MSELLKSSRKFLIAALAAMALVGLSACGSEHDSHSIVEGEPAEIGELEFKVLFTRPLNMHDVEDREYTVGHEAPEPGKMFLGVFITIKNLSDSESFPIPRELHVQDTDGNVFEPLESESIYALDLGGSIGPGDFVPAIDSTPQVGPIEGSLLLYEITDESAENRPLELIIPGPDEDTRVTLDI